MKLGEFRNLTRDLPDDTDILVNEGDLQFAEVDIDHILPPVLEHSNVILLGSGQVWNYELDLDARLDAHLGI
jgi:hypothetical protein